MTNTGIANLDGFRESLRLLLVDEGYSMTDIGLMFGVSRERIRQIAEREGIPTNGWRVGLNCCRVWCDGESRFRPLSRKAINVASQWASSLEKRSHRIRKYDRRWEQGIAVLRPLAASIGRVPTIPEFSEAIGMSGANPGYVLARFKRHAKHYSALRDLWRAAGLKMSPVGRPPKKRT